MMNVSKSIIADNTVFESLRAHAMLVMHAYLQPELRFEHACYGDPYELWTSLEEFFSLQQALTNYKNRNRWNNLRLCDFKTVSGYNSATLRDKYAKMEFSSPGDLIQLLLTAEQDGTFVFNKRMRPRKRFLTISDIDDESPQIRSPTGNLTSFRFNKEVARKELVRYIVVDKQPFSLCEDDPFKRREKMTYEALFQPPSRNTVKADIFKYYKSELEKLKNLLQNTPDNASSNDRASNKLSNWLPIQHSGQYFHVRCCCHILNLMVKDGLDVCKDALENDYEASGKFNASLMYVESNLSQPQTAAERIREITRRGAHSGGGSNELSRYLESDTIDDVDFDVLKWWKVNEIKFPILTAISRDILAILVSTVASEAAFNGARWLITDYRSSLEPDTIEATMCLRDWYLAEDKNQDKLLQGSEEELELE
ncbi:hypothetical protein GIB67_030434 [Kingdonia uniflora]|uniref:HAT C-terminal dimerisation domain-containing protein n=1 Tax=Kingdonia uniflora TaxID=39325 RepID=A0A7J7NE50_9MAGN|nr:hypothetical protein GIB67_030434 [Kingdonia uniflora]